nr:uncharacterized protein LOC124814282 isoform X1 [Hydra vulgaris]
MANMNIKGSKRKGKENKKSLEDLKLKDVMFEFVPHVIQDQTSPESVHDPITSTPALLQVQDLNDLPMHYCPYCFFKCINERKQRGHVYHFHPMQKYKCHVCYQQFSCYSSLTSHSSRKHKINLTNLPFTNMRVPISHEAITINAENQIMEVESLVLQQSYEKLFCDLKLKFTSRKFVPETTFNENLSDYAW